MRIHYIKLDINIHDVKRISTIRPVFHIYDDPFLGDNDDNTSIKRDNLHTVLVNSYEDYVKRYSTIFIEKISQDGVLPKIDIKISVSSLQTSVSLRSSNSNEYIEVADNVVREIEELTYTRFLKFTIANWLNEISRCLGMNKEHVFKIVNEKIIDEEQ